MKNKLLRLAKKHGTPLFVIDHKKIIENYREFKAHLPRVSVYYAIKANPEPAIIKTLFKLGAGFDVASIQEFDLVMSQLKFKSAQARKDYIYDKIIVANTIKPFHTLEKLIPYRTLMTFDNAEEIKKIKDHCPNAGLVLRIRVPNIGSVVELSSKFGEDPANALNLVRMAEESGLHVEGLSFHVGSQCVNVQNYLTALNLCGEIYREARKQGFNFTFMDIGGGFPANYDGTIAPFKKLAKVLSRELDRLFPKTVEIAAEPGRFMVANSSACVTSVVGKAYRDSKQFYYIDDGVYGTFSGVIFDHCQYHFKAFKEGPKSISTVVGPTCDALDTISTAENLPELEIGDMLYSEDIGAYSCASATNFNGFDKAKILHLNAL